MISCSQAVKQLWDYIDGAVEGSQREALEEHLGVCRRCCGEVEFAQELSAFLAKPQEDEIPDYVRARLTSFLDRL